MGKKAAVLRDVSDAATQFGEQAGLHAQSYSPVPVAFRSRASVRNYIKGRKLGLRYRIVSVRFPAVSYGYRASGSNRKPTLA